MPASPFTTRPDWSAPTRGSALPRMRHRHDARYNAQPLRSGRNTLLTGCADPALPSHRVLPPGGALGLPCAGAATLPALNARQRQAAVLPPHVLTACLAQPRAGLWVQPPCAGCSGAAAGAQSRALLLLATWRRRLLVLLAVAMLAAQPGSNSLVPVFIALSYSSRLQGWQGTPAQLELGRSWTRGGRTGGGGAGQGLTTSSWLSGMPACAGLAMR